MKKLNWKAPAVYTTIGAIVGSTLMSSPAAMAEQSFKSYWAKFAQNGQQSGSAAAILYGGTNYFGIYYLQQLLKQDGISVSWDGKELQLSGVPVQQTTTLSVAGSTPSSSTSSPLLTDSIQVNGVTYVPLSTVQAMLSSSGVHLREGDQTDGSGGTSNTANSSIGAGSVQRVVEHLKEAVSSLSEYAQAMAKIQQQTSLLQGLFSPREGGHFGDTKGALQQLASAMQKMQSAYADLTALASAASSTATTGTGTTGTSGTGTTGSSSTSGSTDSTGTTGTSTSGTSGSGTGSSSGTTTTTIPTLSNADLATKLQTIAAAIQQDITNLNALAMASLGTSNSGGSTGSTTTGTTGTTSGGTTGTSSSSSDTSGGSGSTTGSSTGTSTTTGTTSGTTTPTSPTSTSPADVSGVVSDLEQQIQSLQAIQAQLGGGDSSGSSSHDN